MKDSDKKYTLDDLGTEPAHREFWEKIFTKMDRLLKTMKVSKGNYDIDDPEIRWVSDRVERWNDEERILSKDEMVHANQYWKKYN